MLGTFYRGSPQRRGPIMNPLGTEESKLIQKGVIHQDDFRTWAAPKGHVGKEGFGAFRRVWKKASLPAERQARINRKPSNVINRCPIRVLVLYLIGTCTEKNRNCLLACGRVSQ